jgi:hypothetical protein
MDISGYLQHARKLSLRVTLRKSVGFLRRTSRTLAQLALDTAVVSYGASAFGLNSAARIEIATNDIPADLRETLRLLSGEYLQHRFDLLGSGWVSPVYGLKAEGFLCHYYRPVGPRAPARDGDGLESIVNRANLSRSRARWKLIRQSDYVPIDWQLDFRSGYRWSAQRPSRRLAIPLDQGADIKVPWELARLQHLPQLALCAILAQGRAAGFETATRYLDEISDQLADFIATNPPRFGINWLGVMDVAIRAANISLTLALLAGAGLTLPPETNSAVAAALDDHGKHVVEHLEYSEIGRGNHYLADLGGLLWTSWLLDGEEADRRLIFAIAEILKEADHQFLADGGNYEGSTNYHRLSGEIVLFALAVIAGLDQSTLARLERARAPRRPWRAGFPELPLRRHRSAKSGIGLLPAEVLCKMKAAADLAAASQSGDGMVVQIGDTDSGRFFKLHPTPLPAASKETAAAFSENTLDHSGFVAGVDALFGGGRAQSMDAVIVRKLIGPVFMDTPRPQPAVADFGDLDALIARWQASPEASRRLRRIPFGVDVDPDSWQRKAFPDFGLYIFRYGKTLVAFRCAGPAPYAAPSGHRHDDNLAIEYRLGANEHRDPGTFVYTPSVKERNAYRAAAAHDAPRQRGIALTKIGANLFTLDEKACARCLCWGPDTVAGEVSGPSGTILRILHFSAQELSVYDCVAPGKIADISPPLPMALGYGRR